MKFLWRLAAIVMFVVWWVVVFTPFILLLLASFLTWLVTGKHTIDTILEPGVEWLTTPVEFTFRKAGML